jgi:sugar phosphate isomerase/epimerase
MITNPIALSTCCCSRRHKHAYAILEEIAEQGFEYTELSHGIRITLVPGIHKALQGGVIKAISVHDFCPLPHGTQHPASNLYEPSSLDSRERKQWLTYSSRPIDFAAEVGAKYAVIHLGSVHFFFKGAAAKVHKYLENQTVGDPFGDVNYQKVLQKALGSIRKKQKKHMDQLRRSLDELISLAEAKGIILGFENREDLEELPMDDEMPALLDHYADCPYVGYWYDPGHSQEKSDLGVISPEDNLKAAGKHLAGVHFQDDTEEGKVHRAIGKGVVDFDPIFQYLKPETPCILELTPSSTAQGILDSKKFLEQKLDT